MAAWNYLSNKMQCYVLYTTVVAVALCFSTMPCNASQIPARFFYHNQDISQDLPQAATHEELIGTDYAPDSAAHGTNTNVRLLRDTGTKPLEFYKELSNVTDVAEFIERFVDKDSIDPQLGLVENIKRSVERAAAINAQPAICMPEKQIVPLLPLTPSIDPDIIYFPSCTRVKRCGGCCNHALMSCQPTESKVNNYKILKFNTQNTRVLGQEVVAVEEHLKCACNCNIKAEDCNAYQTYDLSRCMCICNNADARSKCSGEENKIWDEQKCRCVCRENISCSTGTFYDHNDCTCVKSGHGDDAVAPPSLDFFDRKRFIVKATAIEQDNSTLYETV